jgi:hypothetical protein
MLHDAARAILGLLVEKARTRQKECLAKIRGCAAAICRAAQEKEIPPGLLGHCLMTNQAIRTTTISALILNASIK